MKFNVILLATILLISCNGTTQQRGEQKVTEENWQIALVMTQEHFYNILGLLDSTHRIQTVYVNGVPGVIMNFLVKREYDKSNNLISERVFQAINKKNELSEETFYKYDDFNNLVLMTNKFENVISKIVKNTYNNKNQKIEEIVIQKGFDENPENWNLDSALAHHDDKKTPHYDTSIISYQYDVSGNQINEFYKDSRQETKETITTLFSEGQKNISFGINSKGDTVSVTRYKKNQNLITESSNDKDNLLYTHTNLYDRGKLIQTVSIDKKMNSKQKETYKYDARGNEIENISYK